MAQHLSYLFQLPTHQIQEEVSVRLLKKLFNKLQFNVTSHSMIKASNSRKTFSFSTKLQCHSLTERDDNSHPAPTTLLKIMRPLFKLSNNLESWTNTSITLEIFRKERKHQLCCRNPCSSTVKPSQILHANEKYFH